MHEEESSVLIEIDIYQIIHSRYYECFAQITDSVRSLVPYTTDVLYKINISFVGFQHAIRTIFQKKDFSFVYPQPFLRIFLHKQVFHT